MPAPVRSTVFPELLLVESDRGLEDRDGDKKFVKAWIAPAGVLADLGTIVGGGKGPV